MLYRRGLHRMLVFFGPTFLEMRSAVYAFLPASRRFLSVSLIALFALAAVGQEASENDPVDLFHRGQDAHEKGELAVAVELYDKALKLLPEFPEAAFQKGSALVSLGRNREAEAAFRRALELRPDWTLAQSSLGSILLDNGDLAEADRLLSSALAADPNNQAALGAMIELRLRSRAPKPVLRDLLDKASSLTAKANPTAGAWAAQAALQWALGQPAQARLSIANALSIDPKNRSALLLSGELAIAEGDIQTAAGILEKLAADRSDAVRLLRANVLAAEEKYEEALRSLASMSSPNTASEDLRKRIVAAQATDPAALEKQLGNGPPDVALLARLCSLYRRQDPAKAIAYCRRAYEAEPSNISHAVGFGAALVQAKQFETAASILRKIIDIAPENATARANLGTALFQLKNYAEAKLQFAWLTRRQPASPGAYLFLGISHDQLGEYTDAAANYQEYVRLADPVENKLDLEKVRYRMPILQKLIKEGKGKKAN